MAFTRTAAGLVAKYRFYDVPIVWVEGPSDVPFYSPVLDRVPARIEPFHGRENCRYLIDALLQHNYPYVIVIDGDYRILKRKRSVHRRVVTLARYSFENYLWEKVVLEAACLNYSNCGSNEDILRTDFEDAVGAIARKLYRLVVLDVAAQQGLNGDQIIPRRPDSLLKGKRGVRFDDALIEALYSRAKRKLDGQSIRDAKNQIDAYLKSNRLVDILRGHFAFGLLRRIFFEVVRRKRGRKPYAEDDAIIQIMAMLTWRLLPSDAHRRLRSKLRRAVRDAQSALGARAV